MGNANCQYDIFLQNVVYTFCSSANSKVSYAIQKSSINFNCWHFKACFFFSFFFCLRFSLWLQLYHIFKDSSDICSISSYYYFFTISCLVDIPGKFFSSLSILSLFYIRCCLYSLMFFLSNFIDLFNSFNGSSPLIFQKS